MANQKKTIIGLIRAARPVHWIKNLSIFAALIFSGYLFERGMFLRAIEGFIIFSMAASATYLLNDVFDIRRDRMHPFKKTRPIASGIVPKELAIIVAMVLALGALYWAYLLSELFFALLAFYLIMQVFYSLALKNIHVIDILIIAAGFVIRVYSGSVIIDAHLSVWFLLCVISIALFLASGKRRAEMGIVGNKGETRKSLMRYQPELLNAYVTMFGSAAWMSWALFTFYESPQVNLPLWVLLAELSQSIAVNKLLMITIPIAIFGIMRYQSLIFEGRSEAPERLLLTDISLVTSVLLWIVLVVWILYGGVATAVQIAA